MKAIHVALHPDDNSFAASDEEKRTKFNGPFAAEQSIGTKIAILESKWRTGTCWSGEFGGFL